MAQPWLERKCGTIMAAALSSTAKPTLCDGFLFAPNDSAETAIASLGVCSFSTGSRLCEDSEAQENRHSSRSHFYSFRWSAFRLALTHERRLGKLDISLFQSRFSYERVSHKRVRPKKLSCTGVFGDASLERAEKASALRVSIISQAVHQELSLLITQN